MLRSRPSSPARARARLRVRVRVRVRARVLMRRVTQAAPAASSSGSSRTADLCRHSLTRRRSSPLSLTSLQLAAHPVLVVWRCKLAAVTLRRRGSAMSVYGRWRYSAGCKTTQRAQSNMLGLSRLSQCRGQLTQRVQSFLSHPLIVSALCVQYSFHVRRHSCELSANTPRPG